MEIFVYLWYAIQIIIGIILLQPFLLVVLCYLKRWLGIKGFRPEKITPLKQYDFGAIITAHQDTRFMKPLVDSLLKQNYQNFAVYVVADACDISNISFDDPRVKLLKPEPDLNSKIKSIDYALANFMRPHELMVVFDSDNLVHPDFFDTVNRYLNAGYRAVQGRIVAKNLDSQYACMDEAGQIVKTFHDKLSRQELGLASTTFGLGLTIFVEDYRKIVYHKVIGGFDKRLQAELVLISHKIAFANEAIIYDEKIPDGQQLQRQRTRWIHSHFKFMGLGLKIMWKGVQKLNFNLFYFGFYLLNPPVFILILISVFLLGINLFVCLPIALAWALGLVSFVLSFPLILLFSKANKPVMQALLTLPVFMYWQLMALLKLKKANKDFLKTEHNAVLTIEEVMDLYKNLN